MIIFIFLKELNIIEQLQRWRVSERGHVLDRSAVDHVAAGEFGDFTALGARDVRNLQDLGRNMPRGSPRTDARLDVFFQRLRHLQIWFSAYKLA